MSHYNYSVLNSVTTTVLLISYIRIPWAILLFLMIQCPAEFLKMPEKIPFMINPCIETYPSLSSSPETWSFFLKMTYLCV